MASTMATLLCLLLLSLTISAEISSIRAKRYEYHVQMPYSSVRIQGSNPIIAWLNMMGKMADNLKYIG
uniref:SCP domain-containing protein n=1 Tax=Steinernema glaseri TaxID=37863 RepID=A0A1I7YBI8_9BILA